MYEMSAEILLNHRMTLKRYFLTTETLFSDQSILYFASCFCSRL